MNLNCDLQRCSRGSVWAFTVADCRDGGVVISLEFSFTTDLKWNAVFLGRFVMRFAVRTRILPFHSAPLPQERGGETTHSSTLTLWIIKFSEDFQKEESEEENRVAKISSTTSLRPPSLSIGGRSSGQPGWKEV